jgi:DNA-binding transcriptional regulator YiaG
MNDLFRNVEGSPSDPVSTWPYEGMVAVIERGNILDWAPIVDCVRQDPWGKVARNLETYLGYSERDDLVGFFRVVLDDARHRAELSERREVQDAVESAWRRSGLTRHHFARALGTSPSRLSTYLSGSVVPSAAMLVRMGRIADRYQEQAARETEASVLS